MHVHVHVHAAVVTCVHNMVTNLLLHASGQIQNFLDVGYCKQSVLSSVRLPTMQLCQSLTQNKQQYLQLFSFGRLHSQWSQT